MHNFNYDEQGFFTGVSLARLDPMATEHYGEPRYLLPRNATRIPTPEIVLQERERFLWDGVQWTIFLEPEPEPEIEPEAE